MFIIYAKKRWARKNSSQPTFNPIEMCVTWNDNDKEKNMGNSNSGKQQKKTKKQIFRPTKYARISNFASAMITEHFQKFKQYV